MTIANVGGIRINYEVLGDRGPWVALSPGGRTGLINMKSMATKLAAAGNRVLIHDRRNCGKSDVAIDGRQSEYEFWADDLYELLCQLKATPAFIGGNSSGCRLSLLFALRYPKAVRALLLWRLSGGPFAVKRLAEKYYGEYIRAAKQGGMATVCETEFFRERIESNPTNRSRLMAMDPEHFIEVMSKWQEIFEQGVNMPVIGASEKDLRSISVPTCIIPGNDQTHRREIGIAVHHLIPNSDLRELSGETQGRTVIPPREWAKEEDVAAVLIDFINRVGIRVST